MSLDERLKDDAADAARCRIRKSLPFLLVVVAAVRQRGVSMESVEPFVSQHRDTKKITIFLSVCTDVPGERGKAANGYISWSNYGIKAPTRRQQW